ncbi:MAG TPA: hypothetical protein VM008_19110 [Phycisphaerae bacterium]|nr:hypothetical protein [Phycisphaerae bacterium]
MTSWANPRISMRGSSVIGAGEMALVAYYKAMEEPRPLAEIAGRRGNWVRTRE